MTARKCFRAGRTIGEDEWRNCLRLEIGRKMPSMYLLLFPLASAGAMDGHIEQSSEEQGISCLK